MIISWFDWTSTAMHARNTLLALTCLMAFGCWHPPVPVEPVKPVDPVNPIKVVDDKFDAASQAAALARLAERQAKSQSVKDGTRRLHGILNELVADGVPASFADAVRKAVPAIKPPTKAEPARNLTPAEIQSLRDVK